MRRKLSATLVLSKSPKCIHNAIVAGCTLTISFITVRLFKRRRPRLRLGYVIMFKRFFLIFWALSKLGLFNPVSSVPIFARSARTSACSNLRFPVHFRSFRTRRFRKFRLCSHILVLGLTCKISGRSICPKTAGSWCNCSSCTADFMDLECSAKWHLVSRYITTTFISLTAVKMQRHFRTNIPDRSKLIFA